MISYKGLAHLEYAGSVRCPPRVQQVIFAGAHEPFSCRGETGRGAGEGGASVGKGGAPAPATLPQ